MCECGCTTGRPTYMLPGPGASKYIVELFPGCDACCTGPTLRITRAEPGSCLLDEELADGEMRELPMEDGPGGPLADIQCGITKEEAVNVAVRQLNGFKPEGLNIDETEAEILGEDFWLDGLCNPPRLVREQKEPS